MAKRTQPARRPRTIAPAVLLLESSVDSEAGLPVVSLGSGVSGAGAGDMGDPFGREPMPPLPEGFAPLPLPPPGPAGGAEKPPSPPLSDCSRGLRGGFLAGG